jgi:hypothetical protein
MKTPFIPIVVLLAFCGTSPARADWACADPKVLKASYVNGQSLEKSGKLREALSAFVAAQANACTGDPTAADAAKRAAAIALPLGNAAHDKGMHELAFEIYESGGHFTKADEALLAQIATKPDAVTLYQHAATHFDERGLPAFRANNQGRLAITGPYSPDPTFVSRVRAMPAQGAVRALQAEATAFNDSFLSKQVQFMQSRPSDPADFAAMQRWTQSYGEFRKQWPKEYMKDAQQALSLLHQWGARSRNAGEPESSVVNRQKRIDSRRVAQTQSYAGAPDLLASALDYLSQTASDRSIYAPRETTIKSQAERLGDASLGRKNFLLAVDYYDVAGATEKAQNARAQMQGAAQARMQPQVDAMKRDAEALKAQFSDPSQVADMQRQAQDIQRAMHQSAAAKQSSANQKSKDDLAKELGLGIFRH